MKHAVPFQGHELNSSSYLDPRLLGQFDELLPVEPGLLLCPLGVPHGLHAGVVRADLLLGSVVHVPPGKKRSRCELAVRYGGFII